MPVQTVNKRLERRLRDVWAIVDRNTQDPKIWNRSWDTPAFQLRDEITRDDPNWYYTCFNTALRDAIALGRAHERLQQVIGIRIYRPMEVVPPDNASYEAPREAFVEGTTSLYTYAAHDLEWAYRQLLRDLPETGKEFRFFAFSQMNDEHMRGMLGRTADALDPDGWRWYSHVVAIRGDTELMTFMMQMPFQHVFDIEKGGLLDY